MPAQKKVKKSLVKKGSSSRKLQKGRIRQKQLFIVIGILVVLVGALFLFKPWQHFNKGSLPFLSKPITVTKPVMDMARARQMTIDPQKDNVMQIVTKEKVRITLVVPKDAIKEKTLVKLIPFYHDPKNAAPTAGVVVGPASINFTKPVTLSYNFTESAFRNNAPKNVVSQTLRKTGTSQVMQIDANASSLTPTLIARELETETYLPARILTGGAYVFSLDGANQVEIARKALNTEGMHTLTVMESATVLLFNDQKLSDAELKKTKAAVAKILSKEEPPVFEYYAALVLRKKITNPSFSLVPKAFAYATDEGFFQVVCKDDRYTVEEYVGFAKSAQLMGHDAIGQSCMDKARNKVAEQTKQILSGSPDLKTVMIALQDVEFLGLDDSTNLDEQLEQKAKEVATENAKKVADNPNSTVVDAAIEMQKMEAVGADNGPTYEKLKQKVTEYVEQKEAAADKASEEYQNTEAEREARMEELTKEVEEAEKKMEEEVAENSLDEEDILYGQAMSALGIGLLQAFGFDKLDKESLQQKFDEMQEQTKGVIEASYAACLEMRAEGIDAGDCEGQKSHAEGLLKQAEEMSYRATTEIGQIQSREYEEPEYLENNGEIELYFEEELTPTPGDEAVVEEGQEEGSEIESSGDGTYEESTYDEPVYESSGEEQPAEESYNQESGSSEAYEPMEYDSGGSSDEEVQGASTKRTNWWWPFR